MMRGAILLSACVLATAGCHTFTPTSAAELEPGQSVRARVTGSFSDTLSTILMRDAREFEAVVVETGGSSLLFEIPVEQGFEGMRFESLSQRVNVPAGELVDVEIKELNRGRTFGAVALVGAVLGAVVVAQLNQDSGGAQRPGEGGPVDAVVSIPIVGFTLSALGRLGAR